MTRLIAIFFSCLLCQYGMAQSSGSITTINSTTVDTDSLQGKKLLVVILPLQEDSAIVYQLVRFQQRHGDSVIVVGLVCTDSCGVSSAALAAVYAPAIEASIIVAAAVTLSNPDDQRASVLNWLCEKNTTSRNTEPGVTGSKYWLSKQGKLYAQLGAGTSLDARVVYNLVRTKVPGEY